MAEKVVILGAGFLGVNAALDIARQNKNKKIILVDKDLNHEYIPSTIDLIRYRADKKSLKIDLEDFLPNQIETRKEEVININTEEKMVETVHSLINYDKLVLGLGGQPQNFGMDISSAEHVWGVKSAEELAEKTDKADSALIIGGGYVGIEAAGEIAEKGLETTIIDGCTRPLSYLDIESSEKVLEILHKKNVKFKGGKKAAKINKNSVQLENGDIEKADVIVWAGGVQANEIIQKTLSTDFKGVKVNNGLSMINEEDVFAGGDCAAVEGQKTAHKAMEQGGIIAENIFKNKDSLKQIKPQQKALLVSIGNTAGLVYKNKIIFTSRILRYFKDMVKTYYFTQLKLKKRFI